MYVDYSRITKDLDNYVEVLTNPNSIYCLSNTNDAYKLRDELLNAILDIGNDYKYGTQVCPYSNLGQRKGKDGYATRRNLRMKRFKKWIIVCTVYPRKGEILIRRLIHQGFPLGNAINLRKGDGLGYHLEGKQSKNPIQECLLWMVKLGCFNQCQVESLKERGIL